MLGSLETYPIFVQRFSELEHVDGSLGNFELSPFAGQVQDRVSGDTRQNESIEWRCDEFTFYQITKSVKVATFKALQDQLTALFIHHQHENVHRADFCDLMIFAIQPKHLVQAQRGGFLLDLNRRCVVAAHLSVANASRPRSGVPWISEK
jgi:hypothetical protein